MEYIEIIFLQIFNQKKKIKKWELMIFAHWNIKILKKRLFIFFTGHTIILI